MLPAPGAPFHPWWFAFNQVAQLPEQLITGRSRFLVDWMFDNLLVNQAAVNDLDRSIYALAYSTRTPSGAATANTRRWARTSSTTRRTRR